MDISIDLTGFCVSMVAILMLIIAGIISLILVIKNGFTDKGEGNGIFLGIIGLFLGFIMVLLFLGFIMVLNFDYTAEITNKYEPTETRILNDRYGAIIEFKEKKFEIDDIKSYESVKDSSFYIEEISYYNFFGSENRIEYNFKLKSE